MARCIHIAYSTGEQCKAAAIKGRTTCRVHGGTQRVGAAHPNATAGGKYSRHLPQRLLDRYAEARTDPELLSHREGIALLDTRIGEQLDRLNTGEAATAWDQLASLMDALDAARAARQLDRLPLLLADMRAVISAGGRDAQVWAEVQSLLRTRRELVKGEQDRLVAMGQMITAEQATTLVAVLTESVRRNVTDPATLGRIEAECRAVLYNGRAVPYGAAPGTA